MILPEDLREGETVDLLLKGMPLSDAIGGDYDGIIWDGIKPSALVFTRVFNGRQIRSYVNVDSIAVMTRHEDIETDEDAE